MPKPALTSIDLTHTYPLLTRGKIRDLYQLSPQTLLFITTDRISAFDVTLKNGIPNKGPILTLLSTHWLKILQTNLPTLQTHFISLDLPDAVLPLECAKQLRNRSMQVRKLYIFPIEAIVRGYIAGSAWKEYQKSGTVHEMRIQPGLRQSEEFPGGKPIYTPSTKAEMGKHDENIHPDRAAELIGPKYAKRIEDLAIALYTIARDYALKRGIIIADTKFEFGLDLETDTVVLVDEVLTPDSSRFWPASSYEVGRAQSSFDKQHLRDWLEMEGLNGKKNVTMPEHVVRITEDKYKEAYETLVGVKWENNI